MASAAEKPKTEPKKRSVTVHVSAEAHRSLRKLSAQDGEPMRAVLERALEQHHRKRFWEQMDTAYAAIQSDPEAMAAEKKEFALWEVTLMDDLDPEGVEAKWKPAG